MGPGRCVARRRARVEVLAVAVRDRTLRVAFVTARLARVFLALVFRDLVALDARFVRDLAAPVVRFLTARAARFATRVVAFFALVIT